ncbi:hypothetical protein E18064_290036 [Elizabethkingia anophelis]|nr:hypothetical protein E18064_290036 [Elizabethkingia anophelis]
MCKIIFIYSKLRHEINHILFRLNLNNFNVSNFREANSLYSGYIIE